MNHALTYGKKAFTWSVVVLTILWSMGFAALIPLMAQAAEPTLKAGDLFQVIGTRAVYLVGPDMKRHPFPDEKTYFDWYKDYSGVIKVTASDTLPEPGEVVPYRPGSCNLFKSITSPSVYMMAAGNMKRKIGSEAVAVALCGAGWKTNTHLSWPDFWETSITKGADITETNFVDGQLVKETGSSDVYIVKGGMLYKVDGTLSSNLTSDVRTGSLSTYTKAATTVTVGSVTENPTQQSGTTVPMGGAVMVSLAANSPSATYVARGGYNVEYSKFTFKASSAGARVDKIVVKRDGFGADGDIVTVRLYDGAKQIGSDQALNTTSHTATFSNINWDLVAGESRTLLVSADTAAGGTGTQDFFGLTAVELEGSGTVSASYPINGNAMQYHSVGVGGLDIDVLSSPGATTLISGATAQEMACFNFDTTTTTVEGFYLKSLKITNTGTASNSELSNFILKEGSTTIGTYAGNMDSDSTVLFDMTASPYFIDKNKSKNLCVSADIKGGITTSKTIILGIAESKHIVAMGDTTKGQVVPTSGNWVTFAAETGATMTIGQGTLTVARNTATLPVASTIVAGVMKNRLTSYRFSAGSTEGARVTRLRMTTSGTNVSSADFANFMLYKYDEVTGTETALDFNQSISGSTITFEDTNAGLFDVAASKNVIINVYADANTSASFTNFNVFVGTTNSNLIVRAKGLQSNEYLTASSITLSSVDSEHSNNILFSSGSTGALVVSLDQTAPSATSVAKGVSNVNFGHYRFYATGENISLTQLVVRAYNMSGTVSTASTTNEFTNVRIYDVTDIAKGVAGATAIQLGTTVSTPSSGASTFNFTSTIPKDDYKVIRVVADIPTASDSVADVLHFDIPGAGTVASDITSTGVASGSDITETGSATGRTMTLVTPALTVSWAGGTTNNVVASAQNQTLGTLQLTAGQYEDVRVSSVKISADDGTPIGQGDPVSSADSDLTSFKLVGIDGTQYGATKNLTSGAPDTVTIDGIGNLTVAKGQTKVIYVKGNIAGTSGTYYVGTTSTADIVATGVLSGTGATITGTGVSVANTIQSVATLTLADASNPSAPRLVAAGSSGSGSEDVLLSLSVDAVYEDVDVTKIIFQVLGATGDSAQNSFEDNGLKLYRKVGTAAETLVGSASFVSSTTSGLAGAYTATFNMAAGALVVGKSTDDVLIVKGKFKGTDNGLTTASSPVIRFGNGTNADDSLYVEARGLSSGTALDDAQFNTTNGLSISSQQVVVYKSYPTFTFVAVDGTLVNGVENNIYSFKAKASSQGAVALKQLKFTMDLVDNVGTYDSSMQAVSFKLFRGSTEITSNVRIQAVSGTSLEQGSNGFALATGTGKAIYITWEATNEELIAANAENTYIIKATLSGFATDADNDYVRVRMDNDDYSTELTQSAATNYLSPWAATPVGQQNILGLDDSTLDGTLATTSTASLLWSDRSASGHSAASGTVAGGAASSTGDWFNGYYVETLPTNYSLLTR